LVERNKKMEKRYIAPRQEPQDLIYGTRAIIEAIESGREIEKILLQRDVRNELTGELLKLAADRNVPLVKVPGDKLTKVTRKNHQGAIAFISPVIYASLDNIVTRAYEAGKDPLILILDRVTDVRNFGAIARTAECTGVDAIVIPSKGSAQINEDAVKTSAGALHHIPVCREHNLKTSIRYLKDNGIRVIAATEKTDKSVFEGDFKGPLAILLGSEEDGVSPAYLEMVDDRIMIPMFGKIGSLNVSVSAAVVLYECIRQQK
jgi:23S rRNA (guanosine2251-2'-O)-methyltransferase